MTDPSPTQVDALVARLRSRLGGVSTPMMKGDNLSITLASAFENPDQEQDENGWTPDAIAGSDEVLEAIHEHYASAIRSLQGELAAMKKERDEADPSFPDALPDEQIRIWINACNHEPARQALRQLLAYRVRGVSTPLRARASQAEALSTDQPRGVRVKPLEWADHRDHTFPPTWTAKTPCGVYEIEERGASDSPAYVATGPLYVFIADKDSLDEAKEAAQADFEKRILSALQEAPAPAIPLTPAEIQSGLDRVRWAENLIRQLPEDHDGRNSWLLNYGIGPKPERREYKIAFDQKAPATEQRETVTDARTIAAATLADIARLESDFLQPTAVTVDRERLKAICAAALEAASVSEAKPK